MTTRLRELFVLLVGDAFFFIVALWVTLLVRYGEMPSHDIFRAHLEPFAFLTIVWVIVYYIAGLYDKHTLLLKSGLPSLILHTQAINVVLAALFFFLVPIFTVAPKTNLLIYLAVSSILIIWWRTALVHVVTPRKRHKALLIADGEEAEELVREVNHNSRYEFLFVRLIGTDLLASTHDAQQKILDLIMREQATILVANVRSQEVAQLLPALAQITFSRKTFMFLDFYRVYEDIFDRLPLSHLRYDWLLEHIPRRASVFYTFTKRCIDIIGAIIIGSVFLCLLPFVALAMRLEGRGEVFIVQTRLGRWGTPMRVYKLRTMSVNKSASAEWTVEEAETNKVTRVGAWLRKTSIDELPQMWNVLKGELSLIGPRNDIEGLGLRLAQEIPYYMIRYVVTPGITGWAQTHQQYAPGNISPQSVEESRMRLAYDLYYVKHRSLALDVAIALRTIKTLLSRFGRYAVPKVVSVR